MYSIVRFTLTRDGAGTKLTVDQDGYPVALHEHLSNNWRPFYFEPIAKHFAG